MEGSSELISGVFASPNGTNVTEGDVTMVVDESLDCPEYNKDNFQMAEEFSFWVEGVFQTIVGILGIFGNIVAGFILSRREMRNSFNLLLVTLACFDSTYLFGSILESFRKQFALGSDVHIILFPHLLYPFTQIAITASIFMTVAIALERFIAVHYPINYSQAMHEANALTKRIFKYVFSVIFLSFLFTFTRFFEANVSYIDHDHNNLTEKIIALEPTEMRSNPIYTSYLNWSRLIVLGIIPFVLLVFLNASIYKDIQARRQRRMVHKKEQFKVQQPRQALNSGKLSTNGDNGPKTNGNQSSNCTNAKNGAKKEESDLHQDAVELKPLTDQGEIAKAVQEPKPKPPPPSTISVNESRCKKEDNMAVIFMGFILVFLVCHLPRLLLNIHELATIRNAMKCMKADLNPFPLWSTFAISISHVLLAINSSTNIFIYCFLSSKFREECVKLYQSLCRKVCITQWQQRENLVETPKTCVIQTQRSEM